LASKHAVVIGRSPILGKPIGMLLLARDATVTYCHSHTEMLPSIVRGADIVVAAVGRRRLVRGDWLKQGAVVIDAGYDGNVGDVDFEEAVSIASLLTPVPGGVGPMTIAVLLDQTIVAAQAQARNAGALLERWAPTGTRSFLATERPSVRSPRSLARRHPSSSAGARRP
jgi:methylenetetrahydrofolate dehydrogenase (NADP+)/methenyltetrahydrofolate cyclohydrolase